MNQVRTSHSLAPLLWRAVQGASCLDLSGVDWWGHKVNLPPTMVLVWLLFEFTLEPFLATTELDGTLGKVQSGAAKVIKYKDIVPGKTGKRIWIILLERKRKIQHHSLCKEDKDVSKKQLRRKLINQEAEL